MVTGAVNHPKVKMLARVLHINRAWAAGICTIMWNEIGPLRSPLGDIGKLSDEQIAEEVFWPDERSVKELVDALVAARLLDKARGKTRLLIHDWPDHAPDFVHKKLARARQYFANGEKPKCTRLGAEEKEKAEAYYSGDSAPNNVRTTSAQRAPTRARRAPKNAPRAHYQTKPIQTNSNQTNSNQTCSSKRQLRAGDREESSRNGSLNGSPERSVSKEALDHAYAEMRKACPNGVPEPAQRAYETLATGKGGPDKEHNALAVLGEWCDKYGVSL